MTTKEIREKDSKALNHELLDKQKHLFELRSQAVTEKLEDPSQLRKTKKEIARIKTVIRQREIEEAAKTSTKPGTAEKKAKSAKSAKSAKTSKKTAKTSKKSAKSTKSTKTSKKTAKTAK